MRKLSVLASVALAASVLAVTPAAAGNGKGNSGNGNGNGGSSGSGSSGSGSSGSSPAPSLPLCKLSDLSSPASACSGFFQGNLLSNNSSDVTAQTDALAALGLTWTGSLAESQLNLSSSLVNFSTALNGVTYVGIHFGAGTSSPSPGTSGGVTAFYRFDAGTALDTFNLAYGSASAARLYSTQAPSIVPPVSVPPLSSIIPVPEPATWVMMILGFGGVGAMLRARRRSVA